MSAWAEHRLGDGAETLIWLHGWGQDRRSLQAIAKGFQTRATNRLFDLPGFGETAMLAQGAGTAEYADALMDQLPPVPAVLIGHSYGARVAVQCAARHPSRVKALVLIAGAGLPRRRSLKWKLRAWALRLLGRLAGLLGEGAKARYRQRFGSADYRAAGALRATLVKAVTEDLSAQAGQVACPVLLLYGDDDTETPPEIGEKYASLMPRARLLRLPGFGHLDILSRGAHQCRAQITQFLDNL